MSEGRRRRSRSAILLAVLTLSAGACVSVDEAASGAEIYDQVCARCHAADLSGGVGPALGAGSDAASQGDEYWIQTIRRGRGRMPSFRSTLTDEQIDRVVAYVREQQRQ